MDNFYPLQSPASTESSHSIRASNNTPHVIELRPDDIESDSGLRKRIENLDPEIRNIASRRSTLAHGSMPTNCSYA
jgi:hypothetical protein